ncbi:hypothetical protein KL86PLE_30193 [uncultured Pleomorphomonas sp.]|uniref:Uncharacterized protein n=1 Tax=uncultured Pleomorphomonas sp. TaxID=442121 RepID=A0A212LDU7_9HYPH|nr:hypothetical protein KL86PLE_30193 [uncultured Pleomorphomonas sp.]
MEIRMSSPGPRAAACRALLEGAQQRVSARGDLLRQLGNQPGHAFLAETLDKRRQGGEQSGVGNRVDGNAVVVGIVEGALHVRHGPMLEIIAHRGLDRLKQFVPHIRHRPHPHLLESVRSTKAAADPHHRRAPHYHRSAKTQRQPLKSVNEFEEMRLTNR